MQRILVKCQLEVENRHYFSFRIKQFHFILWSVLTSYMSKLSCTLSNASMVYLSKIKYTEKGLPWINHRYSSQNSTEIFTHPTEIIPRYYLRRKLNSQECRRRRYEAKLAKRKSADFNWRYTTLLCNVQTQIFKEMMPN